MKKIPIEKLAEIMVQLRTPVTGCPWDLEQDYKSIIPYTIEEVYEVVDAIERNDYLDLKSELGDLLFQIVFYAQLASEEKRFDLADVVESINEKLIKRHPHVFSKKSNLSKDEISRAWEDQKHQERKEKTQSSVSKIQEAANASLLDDIPMALPELKRAQKIQKRVAKQGFDWENIEHVWDKLAEESLEVRQAAKNSDAENLEEEIGDLLFMCVNLSRHYKVDADVALRRANKKFDKRFRKVEELADFNISKHKLEELENFWHTAKKGES